MKSKISKEDEINTCPRENGEMIRKIKSLMGDPFSSSSLFLLLGGVINQQSRRGERVLCFSCPIQNEFLER